MQSPRGTGWTDYSNLPSGNVVGPKGEIGPYTEGPPDEPKEYATYRRVVEDSMRSKSQECETMGVSVMCEHRDADGESKRKWRHKDGHLGAPVVFACQHIIIHDTVSPEHMYYIPFGAGDVCGYVVCHTCFKLLGKYKLNIKRDVMGKCGRCVFDVVTWLQENHPDRWHDLTLLK